MKVAAISALVLLALIVAGCGGSGSLTAPRIDDLPEIVQNKIKAQADPGKIVRIQKETDNGRTIYHVTFIENQGQAKISIAENGLILSDSRHRVIREPAGAALGFGTAAAASEFGSLPPPVQRAVGARTSPKSEIVNVRQVERRGTTLYEIEFDSRGRNPRMFVTEEGVIIEDQRDPFRQ